MMDNMDDVQPTYDANPAISEAVSNILHSSDLTSLSALVHQNDGKRAKEHRVKRPMNAFMLYAQVARRKVATKYPNLNYAKLSKTLGKIWQVLPEEERRPFIQEAERLRAQHKLKHPDYKYAPKRLKGKKTHGISTKKGQYENLKPEDLLNILQCDPTTFQLSANTGGLPVRHGSLGNGEKLPLNLPMFLDDPMYSGQSLLGESPNSADGVSSPRNPFNGDADTFQYLDPSSRGLNRTGAGFPSIPGNDLRLLFSDPLSRPGYSSVNQLLDSLATPNLLLTQKPSSLATAQQLFSKQDVSPGLTSHGTTSLFNDSMDISQFSPLRQKLFDPMESVNSLLEGKGHLSNYLTV